MTTNQLFFAMAGLVVALMAFFKYYFDAKIDPIDAQTPVNIPAGLILH